jgi:hypothetical protein
MYRILSTTVTGPHISDAVQLEVDRTLSMSTACFVGVNHVARDVLQVLVEGCDM